MSFTKDEIENMMSNTITNLMKNANFIEAIVDGMQKGIMTHEIFWKIFDELYKESDTLGRAFADDIVVIGLACLYNYCKHLAKITTKKADPAPEATKDDEILQRFTDLMDKLEDDHK